MDQQSSLPKPVGRGTGVNPPNRFERVHVEDDFEQIDPEEAMPAERRVPTVFLPNDTRRLITENDSPDVPFRYSINPYRGCEHGCAYCYARPGHETLGLNAGLDFETQYPGEIRRPRAAARRAGRAVCAASRSRCPA